MDVDVILQWPLSKIKEYMAFFLTENTEWKKAYELEQMSPEDHHKMILAKMGVRA